MALVLGVDSSTQATKVEVRDADTGMLVSSGRAPHPRVLPPCSEQAPTTWWAALSRACFETEADHVDAIAVAGQQHGMVVTDDAGHPLRDAKLWNDTESAPQAAALVADLGAAGWADACGSVPLAAFTVAKVAWLAAHDPDTLAQVHHLLLPHDWLHLRLCERAVTDRGDASGTGYWSPAEGRYRPDLLASALTVGTEATGGGTGIDDLLDALVAGLPEVLGPTDVAGELTSWAADQLGLRDPAHTLVAAGTGDNMAAALGVALHPGDVAVSLGTSGTVYAVSDTPTADASGAVAGFADATGHYLPLVCTLNATQVTDTVASLLGVDLERLDLLALDAPVGSGGLTLLPYLNGERTPDRPDATGVLSGLRVDAPREHLARVAFEGVICGLLDGLDALRTAGVPVDGGRLVLVGGGARSSAYRRVLADLAQRAVVVPAEDEHVALGACVQAAATLHRCDPLEVARAWSLGDGHAEVIEPHDDAATREAAAATRAAYAACRDAT